jgi:hypothetical protein
MSLVEVVEKKLKEKGVDAGIPKTVKSIVEFAERHRANIDIQIEVPRPKDPVLIINGKVVASWISIGFLYRMMFELKFTGYNVVAVGKAFDDDLYVYVSGRIGDNKIFYRGFTLKVLDNFDNIEGFERMNWYMQAVD